MLRSTLRHWMRVASLALMLGQAAPVAAQTAYDGFNPPAMNGFPTALAVRADGKILISGHFSLGNSGIARLFPDGSHDPTFVAGGFSSDTLLGMTVRANGDVLLVGESTAGNGGGAVALVTHDGSTVFHRFAIANGAVHSAVEQAAGKILIAGAFTEVMGQARPRIARLNADGSLDAAYVPPAGANGTITRLVSQPDGKVLAIGDFTTFGGRPRVRIARLNADGSLDAGFDLPTGANGSINSLAVQPDGKILIGGAFTAAGHAARNYVARMNADGSLDAGFPSGAGPNGPVNDIVFQTDGRILIVGHFLAVDGRPRTRVARLHHDGALDERYPPNDTLATGTLRAAAGVNAPVTAAALQRDGKVVVIGPFTEADGKPRSGVARLNTDGSLDANLEIGPYAPILGWQNGGTASVFNATTIQPDGKFLIGGQFDQSHGVPRKGIVRFNADGSLDLGFDPGAGASFPFGNGDAFSVASIVLQSDEKILVGGTFTSFDDVPSPGLVRLHRDGSRDATFSLPALYPSDNSIPAVSHIAVQPDHAVLVAGYIQTQEGGGYRKILRFLPDGSLDPSFRPYDFAATNPWTNYVIGLQVQNDGRILLNIVAGDTQAIHLRYMIRLYPDGSLDPSFHLNLDLTANGQNGGIDDVVVQPDGKILIFGGFKVIRGQPRTAITRLNAEDGSLDPSFVANVDPSTSPRIASVALQPDGSMLITSDLNYLIDGARTGKVARLLSDGRLDRRFDFTPPVGPYSAGFASRLAVDASGKTLMAGQFNWQYPGTQCCDSVARISPPEPARQALVLDTAQTHAEWLRASNGPEFNRTTFEWSVDGQTWALAGAGRLIPAGVGSVAAPWVLAVQAFDVQAGQVDTARQPGPYLASPMGQVARLMHIASLAGARTDAAPGRTADAAGAAAGDTEHATGGGRGGALKITATGGTPQNTVVGLPLVNGLGVRVTDVDNLPVADVPVTFSAPASGAGAVLSSTTVTTNVSGNAVVDAVANGIAGGYVVTASIASSSNGDATFRLANLVSSDLTVTAIGATTQSTPVGHAFADPIAIRLAYANGAPAAGVTMIFATDNSPSQAMATLTSTDGECWNDPVLYVGTRCEITTDANGEAQVRATANGHVGTYTYYAYIETPAFVYADFQLTNTEATGEPKVVISQLYRSSTATAPYSNDFIELFNAGDAPADLTGWSVQYATGSSTAWTPIDLTDVLLQPGHYYLIQGAVGSAGTPALPAPDATTDLRLNNLTGRVALVRTGTLLDGAGCPTNTGDLVDFLRYSAASVDACGWGTGAPTPTSALALKRLGEGCSASHDNSRDFSRQTPTPRTTASPAHACVQLNIEAIGGTPQSTDPNTAFAVPLTVRVTDEGGAPADNVTVSFAAPGSGASAALSAATATTNAAGEASITATANAITGHYQVTATIDGASVGFELTNALSNVTATAIGGTPQSARVNQPFAAPLTVRLTAQNGQPVVNVAVTFAAPGGAAASAALSATTVTTDSNGEARVDATANGRAGRYTVSATIADARADFVLTNTNTVVISQFQAGDDGFVELFNAGIQPQDLSGWSVQTAAAPSSSVWSLTPLTGVVLQPGQYYLIQAGQGAGWPALPAPDVTGAALGLSTFWGRAALVDTTGPLTGTCPADARIVDFVGYGSGMTCFWGSPAPAHSDVSSELRRDHGCATTGDNGADFEVVFQPVRRSTASPVYRCDQIDLAISAIGGTPQSAPVQHGFATPLAVRVVNGTGQPVSGVEVAFAAPAAGAAAILSSTTAITDGNGEASITASANQWAGRYPVTARLATDAAAQFDLTNTGTLSGPRVVISQIYPGSVSGSGSYFRNFVELFNAGDQPASLYGWSLQIGGAVTALPGMALQPGQRFLIALDGYGGTLPPADANGSGNAGAPWLALVAGTQPLTGSCPAGDASIIDFVGHGTGTCAWGTVAPAPSGSRALIRNQNGCAHSADNAADFSIADPVPRNSASPFEPCGGSAPAALAVTVLDGAGQTAGLNKRFTRPLKVRVTTTGGVAAPGRTVNFLVQAEGATAALSSVAVETDGNGEASVIATANAVTGPYAVRAVVGTARADIGLSNIGELDALSTPGQQAYVNAPFRELRVRVIKEPRPNGNAEGLPNVPVQFTAPASGASALLSATTVVTDANGEARVGAVANGLAGSYAVTARIAGTAAPVNLALTNLTPDGFAQPWDGWSVDGLNLPRNRNVWVRARGFTADGSIHESVKLFYPTGGHTATPVAGAHGRIEPAIAQGGAAGTVLSFTIVPDAGHGISSVTGCGGSLNGSTYLTAPLAADCEVVASFSGGVATHTVIASAGAGGTIAPAGAQTVNEGETMSFLLIPGAGQQVATVAGTCGGVLTDEVFTTAPVTGDCTVQATFRPASTGDRIFVDGFDGPSP
ncbi:Ig-like domain-containing protein [Dokdonella koreensis]|nr:lamin tail domain-containing protein [Dokdonella koreensis]